MHKNVIYSQYISFLYSSIQKTKNYKERKEAHAKLGFNEKPPLYYLTPESKEKTKERMKKLSQGVEVPEFFEVDIVRTDGEQRTLELGFADITIDGEPYRLSTYNDITERKEAEEKLEKAKDDYRTITNLTGDIIVQVDTEGRWTFLNDGACEFWGKPREELIGSAFGDYVHPDDQEKTMDAVENMMESGETVRGV